MRQSWNDLFEWSMASSHAVRCDSLLHMWSSFNMNLTCVTWWNDLNNSLHFMHVFSSNTRFSCTHTHTENVCTLSITHTQTHTHAHGTHKIQMSPHSILCETLLSWLLPWVLLRRIGMLIKACSLKLIRHWPGSFIKIDILPQHTQMSWSRTWEGAAEQS